MEAVVPIASKQGSSFGWRSAFPDDVTVESVTVVHTETWDAIFLRDKGHGTSPRTE